MTLSLDTAYRSFGGEVEASSTPTICRLPDSRRHQLSTIAPPRTASGRRVYGPAETRTLAFIRRSRDLGFTLEEVRALLALGGPERASCADVHKIASAHLASVRNKLSDLVKLESILAETVAQCSDRATPDCPVLDILDAGRQSELDRISNV